MRRGRNVAGSAGRFTGISKPNQRVEAADARRRRILQFAAAQFRRHGYAQASLNSIVRQAGGSKASITKYFGNKAGLFAAVMGQVTQEFVARLDQTDFRGTPMAGLNRLGIAILSFYLEPAALMTYRGIVGEGHRHQEMAAGFYRAGHGGVVAAVAAHLQRWHNESLLQSEDPEADADRFTHILRGGLYEQTLLGLHPHTPTTREIEAAVRPAVRTFLRGLMGAPHANSGAHGSAGHS
jgi:AcrR family transcriptional regulator